MPRLIVCNNQFIELYDLDPEIIKPGILHSELVEHWLARGNRPPDSTENYHDTRMQEVRTRRREPCHGVLHPL